MGGVEMEGEDESVRESKRAPNAGKIRPLASVKEVSSIARLWDFEMQINSYMIRNKVF